MSAPPAKKPRSGREKTGKEKTSRKIAKEKGGIESDLEHFLQKGDAHRKAGQYKDAIQVLDRALMLKPCARAFAARGSAKRALLLREQALADYSAAVKTEPLATYYSSRGVVKSELGWYRDALEDFQRSLKLDPEDKVANWGKEWIKRQEAEAPLRIITLGGFKFMAAMNTRYTERRSPEHAINGRETYWSHDNNHLLYWSSKERRWKGCRAVDVGRISGQSGPACIGAPENVHVLSPSLRRGWFEWNGKEWVKLEGAGLLSFGPVTAPLRALQLVGFWRNMVNTSYVERRHLEFIVNSRETYWSTDGSLFLYWCPKETRWRGSRAQDLLKVQQGESVALFGAPRGNDILSSKRGWHELQNKEWIVGNSAGANIDNTSLRTRRIFLVGFAAEGINGEYRESRLKELMVNDREIYLEKADSTEMRHFLYWSKVEQRWKGTLYSNLQRIQGGKQSAIIGAPQMADILDCALLKGWHEWTGADWAYRPNAGVGALGVCSELVVNNKALDSVDDKKRKRSDEAPRRVHSREELIKEVFAHFDTNKDRKLKAREMLAFASSVGFDGTEEEWQEEYRLICEGLGRSPDEGIDEVSFLRLVNEDTDDGCYCSDKELAGMLGRKWPPPRVVS